MADGIGVLLSLWRAARFDAPAGKHQRAREHAAVPVPFHVAAVLSLQADALVLAGAVAAALAQRRVAAAAAKEQYGGVLVDIVVIRVHAHGRLRRRRARASPTRRAQ